MIVRFKVVIPTPERFKSCDLHVRFRTFIFIIQTMKLTVKSKITNISAKDNTVDS